MVAGCGTRQLDKTCRSRASCCSASTVVLASHAPSGGLQRRSKCGAAPLQDQFNNCLSFAALQRRFGHCQLCTLTSCEQVVKASSPCAHFLEDGPAQTAHQHRSLQHCSRHDSCRRHTCAEHDPWKTLAASPRPHTHLSAIGAPGPGHAGARAEGVQRQHAPPPHSAAGPAAAPRHLAAAPRWRVRPAPPATRTAVGGHSTPWGVPAQLPGLRSQNMGLKKSYQKLAAMYAGDSSNYEHAASLTYLLPLCPT